MQFVRWAAVLAMLISVRDISAGIIAQETFEDYTPTVALDTLNGGADWTSAWSADAGHDVVSSSISYNGTNVSVSGGNNALQLNGPIGGGGAFGVDPIAIRQFTPQSSSFWVSFLIKPVDTTGNFYGFIFSNDGDRDNGLSIIQTGDEVRARARSTGDVDQTSMSSALAAGADHLVVAHLQKSGANFDRIDIWVDPDVTTEGALGPSLVFAANNIGVGTLSYLNIRDAFGVGESHVSNFTLGDSYQTVIGVPEPSTWLLALLGMAGLAIYRRRTGSVSRRTSAH